MFYLDRVGDFISESPSPGRGGITAEHNFAGCGDRNNDDKRRVDSPPSPRRGPGLSRPCTWIRPDTGFAGAQSDSFGNEPTSSQPTSSTRSESACSTSSVASKSTIDCVHSGECAAGICFCACHGHTHSRDGSLSIGASIRHQRR